MPRIGHLTVPPTPLRERALRYTGRGVTIAMLDAGFSAHPDLTQPTSRILAYYDATGEGDTFEASTVEARWHGTQTSVVAAGNGWLSGGTYAGIACDASVVLVKVGRDNDVAEAHMAEAFRWVLAHRETYGIRVVNVSVTTGDDRPYEQDEVDRLAEEAVRQGIVVVAAAGNLLGRVPFPPSNAPSVITVGGYYDLDPSRPLYDACAGLTADQLLKPELIAPSAGIAAPILLGTPQEAAAQALMDIVEAPPDILAQVVAARGSAAGLPEGLEFAGSDEIARVVSEEFAASKCIARYYQHAEGTSFSAPIVASVVAQMLEVSPHLQPDGIRQLLIGSADRLANAPWLRQGYGVLDARRAVEFAGREQHPGHGTRGRPPAIDNESLVFVYHDDEAFSVEVAGDFNDWRGSRAPCTQEAPSMWVARVPAPAAGTYAYKFLVDGTRWVDDPANGHKAPDPYGGTHSLVSMRGGEDG
ncbi:MAG: serine protease [Armatimonadetes bacterium]|nr:serine protease [Armatimonadota bacterium]